MVRDGHYTTQLNAGLGMVSETLALLKLWEPGDGPTILARKAVDEGIFSRTTARRARNVAAEMFGPRYLAHEGEVARRLKFLTKRRFPASALLQIFYLQTARAQAIFSDFVLEVYWPRYGAGAAFLTRKDSEDFIRKAMDAGKMRKRWAESTVKRVSGYLIGCCIDYGLLGTGNRQKWPIQRFVLKPQVALYLAHDLHFSGLSDMSIVAHLDWELFGLERQEVLAKLKKLANDGHFTVQSTADLVQISWKYATVEDSLHALVDR